MTDKELLEAAARAAGYEVRWHEVWGCFVHEGPFNTDNPPTLYGQRMVWAPLTDDGDALRLAVKLNLNTEYLSEPDGPEVWVSDAWSDTVVVQTEPLGKNPLTATRRAIVRAAAEIGSLHNAMYPAAHG